MAEKEDKDCGVCKYSELIKKTCGELPVDLRMACKQDIVDVTLEKISHDDFSRRLRKKGVEKRFVDAVEELF